MSLKAAAPGQILRKAGTGTLILGGANTHSGGTIVSAGTLQLNDIRAAGSGAIDIASGAMLDMAITGNQVLQAPLSGSGALQKSGSGSLEIAASSVNPGSVTVLGGGLLLPNALETNAIDVRSSATLTVGHLWLSGGRVLSVNAPGNFTFGALHVAGLGNRVNGDLPSAAGKNLYFVLPGNTAKGDTLLTIAGKPLVVDNANISISLAGKQNKLRPGDTVTLISKTSGQVKNPGGKYTASSGASVYTFALAPSTDSLGLTLQNQEMSRRGAKAYLEGRLAGLVSLADSGRFVASAGVAQMARATEERPGMGIMAAISVSTLRENTGSKVDVNNYSAMSGPVWRIDTATGISRLALFVEAGKGTYDTYNSFSTGSINGDGDVEHYGGGILARHDWRNGLYAEASFRAGRVRTEFSSDDMGRGADYDSESGYAGAHLGLGWIYPFTEQDSLDFYGKFFWTQQDSDSLDTDADERLHLKSAQSILTRLGFRYTRNFNGVFSGYAGLAWDHEFDGRQSGTLDGVDINAPDLKGDSAFGEIGVRFKPEGRPWSVDLTGHGSLGQREGVGGNLSFSFEF